jgi:hypothetical protein
MMRRVHPVTGIEVAAVFVIVAILGAFLTLVVWWWWLDSD